MPQRWLKTVVAIALTGMLFTACRKSEFSEEPPLSEIFSPLIYTISQNNFLYALDPANGVRKWELKLPRNTAASPVIIGDFIYLAIDSLYKIDAKRGKLVKVYDIKFSGFSRFSATPYADGNILYIGSDKDTLYAFDVANENIKWKFSTETGAFTSSPTVSGNQVFIGNENGNVYAVDKMVGTQTWRCNTPGNNFTSSPTVAQINSNNKVVYICGTAGKLFAINASDGVIRWDYQYATGSTSPILTPTSSPIAYGGNVVFGGYDYYVYCIDTVAKKERWKFKTGDRVISSPAADDNVVYVGSHDYVLYALNIIDGSERWKFRSGALIKSSPLLHNGTVYMGSYDKTLYAIDTSGKLKWSYNTNGIIESSPVLWDLSKAYYPSVTGMSKY